ncbi:MAG: DEAD/DEAH box helicase [Acidobacteria bacterium]|nr:DEAD/DEAH box helicase [Acidobacteriota bacterium]
MNPNHQITRSPDHQIRKDAGLDDALKRLAATPRPYAGGLAPDDPVITAMKRLPAVEAIHAPWPDLHPRVLQAYADRGIDRPYCHQAEAIAHAVGGRNVVVITPTASGKTLCYNAPVLSEIVNNPGTRALYLFPTKALAQDQLAELYAISNAIAAGDGEEAGPEIGVFTYDGDTPADARRAIRGKAHVVLTNPDMVHSGILPHHPRWAKLFENLRYVVIDELHAYRGVFGSHLANIARRLQRICRHYGSDPVFICSSATIANPRELAERLVGKPFELVEQNGAPRGEKFFLFVNPPVVNAQLGIRRSYLAETRRVAGEFLKRGLQVIVFAQSRLSTEILTTYLKEAFDGIPGTPEAIRGYRGGYLPLRRREIERGLRDGTVRGVVSTNALELGIDIGALDVCVMAGYPGTIASTWQRAGRAGRRAGRSAAVMVASSAPLDQFIVRNPDYFFGASPEHALINPDNLHILLDHVKCAAFELPFTTRQGHPDPAVENEQYGTLNVQEVLAILGEEGYVHEADGQWSWTHESYPADAVSLRSISSDNFVVVDTTHGEQVIAETDFTSAPAMLHEKAIYLMEGRLFQVETFDFDGRKAFVRETDCDYYTDAITYTRVTILETLAEEPVERSERAEPRAAISDISAAAAGTENEVRGLPAETPAWAENAGFGPGADIAERDAGVRAWGDVHVVSRVVGFKKIKFYTNENVGSGELDLPEQQMHTSAYWLTVPRAAYDALPWSTDDRRDGVAGLAYAMHSVAQLLLMCDRGDIGLSVTSDEPTQGAERGGGDAPRVFIYDNYPGGIGFSEPLYLMHRLLLERTREMIEGCPCPKGCPSCVGPEGNQGPLAKTVATTLLAILLDPKEDAA